MATLRIQKSCKDWDSVDAECPVDKAVQLIERSGAAGTWAECTYGDDIVKPYFDIDMEYPADQQPTADTLDEEHARYTLAIRKTMAWVACVEDEEVVLALAARRGPEPDSRGYVVDGQYRCGFRVYVQGMRIKSHDLKAICELLHKDLDLTGVDTGINPAGRRALCCVGSCKLVPNMERQVLRKLAPVMPTEAYLVQVTAPEHPLLALPPELQTSQPSSSATSSGDLRSLMEAVPPEHCITGVVPGDNSRSYLLTSSSRFCANVGRDHRSNHVYFVAKPDGIYQRCHDEDCSGFAKRVADSPAWLSGQSAAAAPAPGPCVALAFLDGQVGLDKLMEEALSTKTPTAIARVIYTLYKDTYVCAGPKDDYYYYDGSLWVRDLNATLLRNRMSSEVVGKFHAVAQRMDAEVKRLQAAGTEAEELKQAKDTLQATRAIMMSLETTKAKNNYVTEYKDMSFAANRSFLSKLDANKDLLGFANGVMELSTGVFRAGRPDDYLTMSTGYAWADKDDAAIQAHIKQVFDSTAINQEVADYEMDVYAYMLGGCKYQERMWFLTGSGRNGKGLKMKLLSAALGNACNDGARGYCYEPNAAIFTNSKTNSAAASPDILRLRGARMCTVAEPEVGWNASLLKALTGGDKITARDLYSSPQSFEPQHGLLLQQNGDVEVEKIDRAFHMRVRVIPHPWEHVVEPTEECERKIDPSLKPLFEHSVEYRQQFARMLVATYRDKDIGDPNRLWVEPEAVKVASAAVMEHQSDVVAFVNMVTEATKSEDRISVDDLMHYFNLWAQNHEVRTVQRRAFLKLLKQGKGMTSKWSHGVAYYDRFKFKAAIGDVPLAQFCQCPPMPAEG